MSVFNKKTVKLDGSEDSSKVDFFKDPPLLLNEKVNQRILDVIDKNITQVGHSNYKEFDLTVSKLKDNGDIRLVEDNRFKLASCLEKLTLNGEDQRARMLVDRIYVPALTKAQNYQIFSHCFAAMSSTNAEVAKSVTKTLVNSGFNVSAAVEINGISQNAVQLAAQNFITAEPQDLEMHQSILQKMLESDSLVLQQIDKSSLNKKVENRQLTKEDITKCLQTEAEKVAITQQEPVQVTKKTRINLSFGKSLLSLGTKREGSEHQIPENSPKFSTFKRLAQKITQVAQQ